MASGELTFVGVRRLTPTYALEYVPDELQRECSLSTGGCAMPTAIQNSVLNKLFHASARLGWENMASRRYM